MHIVDHAQIFVTQRKEAKIMISMLCNYLSEFSLNHAMRMHMLNNVVEELVKSIEFGVVIIATDGV